MRRFGFASRLAPSLLVCLGGACSLTMPTDEELAGGDPRSGGTGGAGSGSVGGAGKTGANAGGLSNGTGASGGSGAIGTSGGVGGTPGAGGSSSGGSSAGLAGGGSSAGGESGGGSSGGGTGGTVSGCVPDVTSDNPPSASWSDAFEDGSVGPGWELFSSDLGCAAESNNRATFTLHATPNQGFYCYYQSTQYFDLTCGSIVVKVTEITRQVIGAQTFIWVEPGAGGRVNLIAEGGTFVYGPEGSPAVTLDYSAVEDLWWRLREGVDQNERQLFFETSPDGTTWLERARIPRPFALDEVRISIGSGTWLDVTDPGRGVFACYNQPSGCD